jgi:hypothetical protein
MALEKLLVALLDKKFPTFCGTRRFSAVFTRAHHWFLSYDIWIQFILKNWHIFGFDSRRYQIFWEVVGLERGPLSLVSTTEELLERNSSGSGPENREQGRSDPSPWPRGTVYRQKLALASPTSGGRSIDIVRSRIEATEFFWHFYWVFRLEFSTQYSAFQCLPYVQFFSFSLTCLP